MRSLVVAACAALAVLPGAVRAQSVVPIDSVWKPRGSGSFAFVVAEPKADFANYVNDGWGLQGYGVFNLERSGVLALRLDGGWIRYGSESKDVYDPFLGGRIQYDLTTSNDIAFLGVGPQLQLPTRYIRPYAYAVGGFAYLSTTSTLEGLDDTDLARDTNYDDWTMQWAAGGGVAIPLYRTRTSDVSLDVGGRYHFNGSARYLREGGITDLPDGSVQLEVLESKVHLVTWHIGLTVGLR